MRAEEIREILRNELGITFTFPCGSVPSLDIGTSGYSRCILDDLQDDIQYVGAMQNAKTKCSECIVRIIPKGSTTILEPDRLCRETAEKKHSNENPIGLFRSNQVTGRSRAMLDLLDEQQDSFSDTDDPNEETECTEGKKEARRKQHNLESLLSTLGCVYVDPTCLSVESSQGLPDTATLLGNQHIQFLHPGFTPLFSVIDGRHAYFLSFQSMPITLQSLMKFNRHMLQSSLGQPDVLPGVADAAPHFPGDVLKRFLVYQLLQSLLHLRRRGVPHHPELDPSRVHLEEDLWLRLEPPLLLGACPRPRGIPRELGSKQAALASAAEQWRTGRLSNLEYLMILNAAAGRRMGDSTYHPVIPWVTDFSCEELDEAGAGHWRNLSKSKFRLAKGDFQLQSTYSEAAAYAHHITESLSEITYYIYMARRTPLAVLRVVVRSNFEAKEYPSSMGRMYSWSPDEAIPEFFTDPSVFRSLHPPSVMGDVRLPPWCEDPAAFVRWHRRALESEAVSRQLHRWIDLNFGHLLSGQAAVEALNVSLPLDAQDCNKFRTNPGFVQLFHYPHPERNVSVGRASLPTAAGEVNVLAGEGCEGLVSPIGCPNADQEGGMAISSGKQGLSPNSLAMGGLQQVGETAISSGKQGLSPAMGGLQQVGETAISSGKQGLSPNSLAMGGFQEVGETAISSDQQGLSPNSLTMDRFRKESETVATNGKQTPPVSLKTDGLQEVGEIATTNSKENSPTASLASDEFREEAAEVLDAVFLLKQQSEASSSRSAPFISIASGDDILAVAFIIVQLYTGKPLFTNSTYEEYFRIRSDMEKPTNTHRVFSSTKVDSQNGFETGEHFNTLKRLSPHVSHLPKALQVLVNQMVWPPSSFVPSEAASGQHVIWTVEDIQNLLEPWKDDKTSSGTNGPVESVFPLFFEPLYGFMVDLNNIITWSERVSFVRLYLEVLCRKCIPSQELYKAIQILMPSMINILEHLKGRDGNVAAVELTRTLGPIVGQKVLSERVLPIVVRRLEEDISMERWSSLDPFLNWTRFLNNLVEQINVTDFQKQLLNPLVDILHHHSCPLKTQLLSAYALSQLAQNTKLGPAFANLWILPSLMKRLACYRNTKLSSQVALKSSCKLSLWYRLIRTVCQDSSWSFCISSTDFIRVHTRAIEANLPKLGSRSAVSVTPTSPVAYAISGLLLDCGDTVVLYQVLPKLVLLLEKAFADTFSVYDPVSGMVPATSTRSLAVTLELVSVLSSALSTLSPDQLNFQAPGRFSPAVPSSLAEDEEYKVTSEVQSPGFSLLSEMLRLLSHTLQGVSLALRTGLEETAATTVQQPSSRLLETTILGIASVTIQLVVLSKVGSKDEVLEPIMVSFANTLAICERERIVWAKDIARSVSVLLMKTVSLIASSDTVMNALCTNGLVNSGAVTSAVEAACGEASLDVEKEALSESSGKISPSSMQDRELPMSIDQNIELQDFDSAFTVHLEETHWETDTGRTPDTRDKQHVRSSSDPRLSSSPQDPHRSMSLLRNFITLDQAYEFDDVPEANPVQHTGTDVQGLSMNDKQRHQEYRDIQQIDGLEQHDNHQAVGHDVLKPLNGTESSAEDLGNDGFDSSASTDQHASNEELSIEQSARAESEIKHGPAGAMKKTQGSAADGLECTGDSTKSPQKRSDGGAPVKAHSLQTRGKPSANAQSKVNKGHHPIPLGMLSPGAQADFAWVLEHSSYQGEPRDEAPSQPSRQGFKRLLAHRLNVKQAALGIASPGTALDSKALVDPPRSSRDSPDSGPEGVSILRTDTSEQRMLVGTQGNQVQLWSITAAPKLLQFASGGHPHVPVCDASFTSDPEIVLFSDARLNVWHLGSCSVLHRISSACGSPVVSFEVLPAFREGQVRSGACQVVLGSALGLLTLVELRSDRWRAVGELQLPRSAASSMVALGGEGTLAVGQVSGHANVVEVRGGRLLSRWKAHETSIIALQVVPCGEGNGLLTVSRGSSARVWRLGEVKGEHRTANPREVPTHQGSEYPGRLGADEGTRPGGENPGGSNVKDGNQRGSTVKEGNQRGSTVKEENPRGSNVKDENPSGSNVKEESGVETSALLQAACALKVSRLPEVSAGGGISQLNSPRVGGNSLEAIRTRNYQEVLRKVGRANVARVEISSSPHDSNVTAKLYMAGGKKLSIIPLRVKRRPTEVVATPTVLADAISGKRLKHEYITAIEVLKQRKLILLGTNSGQIYTCF